ncbi:hypothetical protein DDB_G0286943 [Dictyostelium discoideum AX4]|uniref:Uncharacterized protein DDB_G0286943 n=1 Tax=Dictyostelium discoideum TaxID=44689 RepID=Y7203_DICDI|nr:hypothetical protein DDB_G0286943 [Dictyostelium discoideum AX4]Q54L25.1 RecName: Full=Uncharacterized protein DDB_G0286943 [Dictyostelium discoideum]EAL63969.1 hypothetical protein DDB_G0286943 [Dictyostelium discoideum AX4]|eukprot:XP_637478.1 hypothetical protein DDB_G0286943 [Dictyostelium discoideum AX4]
MGNAPSRTEPTCDNSINFIIPKENKSYQCYPEQVESNPIDSINSVYFYKTT